MTWGFKLISAGITNMECWRVLWLFGLEMPCLIMVKRTDSRRLENLTKVPMHLWVDLRTVA